MLASMEVSGPEEEGTPVDVSGLHSPCSVSGSRDAKVRDLAKCWDLKAGRGGRFGAELGDKQDRGGVELDFWGLLL